MLLINYILNTIYKLLIVYLLLSHNPIYTSALFHFYLIVIIITCIHFKNSKYSFSIFVRY